MKITKLPLLCLFLLLFSQQMPGMNIIKFEPAIIEVDYIKHVVLDTVNPDSDFNNTVMTLRLGRTTSSFFSPKKIWRDSLLHYNYQLEYQLHKEAMAQGNNHLGGKEKEFIFKNYPVGHITAINSFDMSRWTYSELWEKPEWILKDSTAIILNMECSMAECSYRGRKWYAFFTTEIPFSDGPWKLCGLPGLILKAWDSRSHYIFEATGIRTENLQDVGIYDYLASEPLKTTHDRYYTDWHKSLHEDIGYKLSQAGFFDPKYPKIPSPRVIPHRNYDFEETDYEHLP